MYIKLNLYFSRDIEVPSTFVYHKVQIQSIRQGHILRVVKYDID